jgi:DNA-binding transcriptional LysR family regulator
MSGDMRDRSNNQSADRGDSRDAEPPLLADGDIQLRHMRYFTAVAEELSFSRAAAALYVSQPSLTRQIRQLEERLGVVLFLRSKRSVELTPAGVEFLARCRTVLGLLESGIMRAKHVAEGRAGKLRVGFHLGAALELTAPILEEYGRRHPLVDVELREYDWRNPSAGVRDGTTDVAIVRMPIELDGLRHRPLFTEPVVLAVSREHPLAGRNAVDITEVREEPMVQIGTEDDALLEFWTAGALRNQRSAQTGPRVRTHSETLEAVARGRGVTVMPAAAVRYVPRPDIRYIPIKNAPRSEVALVWRSDFEDLSVAAFVASATMVRDRERAMLREIRAGAAPSGAPRRRPAGPRGHAGPVPPGRHAAPALSRVD